MSGAAFLRVKKLKGGGIVTVAARHNKREIQAEKGATSSIDPERSHLNYTLAGPAAAGDVGQLAKDLMTAVGVVKLRKDAVMGLEIVFSLPPGHAIDDRAYFTDCATWIERYFGGVILSVDVHKDEAAPHCHVLLLPLIDGRMAGSDMLGGKQMLMTMQKQFHLDVSGLYGLSKAPAKLTVASKQAASKAVLQRLRETGDKALQSNLWATLRDVIERDPMPFLMALGIELQAPAKKLKTFTQIMTSKGKGKAKEANPIRFTTPEKRQTLCSVGFTPKAPPQPATSTQAQQSDNEIGVEQDQPLSNVPNEDGEIAPPAPRTEIHDLEEVIDDQLHDATALDQLNEIGVAVDEVEYIEATTRHHDCDLDPARYDASGDYCPRQPPAPRRHQQAVNGALRGLVTRSTAHLDRQPSQRFPT